jgi:hypothetical protein
MSFFRARWRGAIHMAVVDHEVEWLDRGVLRVVAVYRLALSSPACSRWRGANAPKKLLK